MQLWLAASPVFHAAIETLSSAGKKKRCRRFVPGVFFLAILAAFFFFVLGTVLPFFFFAHFLRPFFCCSETFLLYEYRFVCALRIIPFFQPVDLQHTYCIIEPRKMCPW